MLQLLGIPYDANSSFLRGPALAPPRIRQMDADGSANRYAEIGRSFTPGSDFTDLGDVIFPDPQPEQAFFTIKNAVRDAIQNGDKLLCLGGDHSVSYPVIDAFSEKHPGLHILHFDAHADLYDNFENNTYSHASPFARLLEKGRVQSLTQVGIRTLNTHQREQAQRFGVHIVEMKDFVAGKLPPLQGPLYISLDLDVLDPAFAPGISHHEPGGISTRELIQLIQHIDVEVVGADIVEYNPVRDVHNMTAMAAYKLMKELMALMA